jgi:hypothetical protein
MPKSLTRHWLELKPSVQDWSLQCPSNAIRPFKTYLSQNNPSEHNPILKMKTSLEVLGIICPPEEPTSVRHYYHYKKWRVRWLILHSSHPTARKHVPHNSCAKFHMSFVFQFYIILGWTSWIWTNTSIEGLRFDSPSKLGSCAVATFMWWLQAKGASTRAGRRHTGFVQPFCQLSTWGWRSTWGFNDQLDFGQHLSSFFWEFALLLWFRWTVPSLSQQHVLLEMEVGLSLSHLLPPPRVPAAPFFVYLFFFVLFWFVFGVLVTA